MEIVFFREVLVVHLFLAVDYAIQYSNPKADSLESRDDLQPKNAHLNEKYIPMPQWPWAGRTFCRRMNKMLFILKRNKDENKRKHICYL